APASPGFAGEHCHVIGEGANERLPRQVAPEDSFLILRLLLKQSAPRSAVGSGNVVAYARCRLKEHLIAGPMQAPRQVDVFEIGAEGLGEGAHSQKRIATKESAGGTG